MRPARFRRTFTLAVVAGALAAAGLPLLTGSAQAAQDAPTSVTASNPGDQSADVSWTAPAPDGAFAITGYTVVPSPDCNSCGGLTPAGTNTTVTGLDNGTAYTFTV